MGLLAQFIKALFGGKPRSTRRPTRPGYSATSRRGANATGWSQRDIQVIAQSAEGMVRVVNESIQIAGTTKNPDTKMSRIQVARDKLDELKRMRQRFPFLTLHGLDEVEFRLLELELQVDHRQYAAMAEGNEKGQSLEKEGRVDEAIKVYEGLLAQGADTPFTYRRLAILYGKRKDIESEMRVLDLACERVSNEWFLKRREKLQAKLKKA
ncbi:MAG TPA: hypothetical protein PK400_11900 [Phycisphaerales bacterium]|nr:hypothetical protein [Phycisphaerales bacterium]HRQ75580.1 hypothetical protein [Phycisphaerales bacterium]